jgi:hypothetical protein
MPDEILRRPISARDTRWAHASAARLEIRPNAISNMCIQLRLLCNRFDGMVTIVRRSTRIIQTLESR